METGIESYTPHGYELSYEICVQVFGVWKLLNGYSHPCAPFQAMMARNKAMCY